MTRWFTGLPWDVRLGPISLMAAAAASAAVSLMEDPAWWLVVLAGLLTFLLGALAELKKQWESVGEQRADEDSRLEERELQRAGEERELQRRARLALVAWTAPTVAEADPFDLGVSLPVPPLTVVARNGLGPYVRRDQDTAEVPEKLRARGQLLIVGDPGSGATRTAYEAALAVGGGGGEPRRLLAPVAPDSPRTVVELGLPGRMSHERVVLWLDRIDTYSPAGLTLQHLLALREARPGMRVVATTTPLAYGQWAAARPDPAAEFDVVRLARIPSPRERQEAAAHYGGSTSPSASGPRSPASGRCRPGTPPATPAAPSSRPGRRARWRAVWWARPPADGARRRTTAPTTPTPPRPSATSAPPCWSWGGPATPSPCTCGPGGSSEPPTARPTSRHNWWGGRCAPWAASRWTTAPCTAPTPKTPHRTPDGGCEVAPGRPPAATSGDAVGHRVVARRLGHSRVAFTHTGYAAAMPHQDRAAARDRQRSSDPRVPRFQPGQSGYPLSGSTTSREGRSNG